MFGFTISSLTKTTNGSTNDAKPLGAPSFFLELRPTLPKIDSRRIKEIKSEAAFFVIERSIIGKPLSSFMWLCESIESVSYTHLTLPTNREV